MGVNSVWVARFNVRTEFFSSSPTRSTNNGNRRGVPTITVGSGATVPYDILTLRKQAYTYRGTDRTFPDFPVTIITIHRVGGSWRAQR